MNTKETQDQPLAQASGTGAVHQSRAPAFHAPAAINTGALAEQAIAMGEAGVNALERVLALAERERDYQARCAYDDALLAVHGALPRIYKDAENTQNRSRFARLESIDRAIRPIYTRNGFRISFDTEMAAGIPDGWIMHVATVSHRGGHVETIRVPLPIDNIGPKGLPTKTEMHGVGSALSYAQRRLTCMAFGVVVTGEDNDAQLPPDDTPVTAEQADWIRTMAAEVYPRDDQREAFLRKFGTDSFVGIPARFFAGIQSTMEQRRKFMAEHPEVKS